MERGRERVFRCLCIENLKYGIVGMEKLKKKNGSVAQIIRPIIKIKTK